MAEHATSSTLQHKRRALVFETPGSETSMVIIKPGWGADCNGSTIACATKERAIEMCWKIWHVPSENVVVAPLGHPANPYRVGR